MPKPRSNPSKPSRIFLKAVGEDDDTDSGCSDSEARTFIDE